MPLEDSERALSSTAPTVLYRPALLFRHHLKAVVCLIVNVCAHCISSLACSLSATKRS